MISFHEHPHPTGECYIGEYLFTEYDDSNYLVWYDHIKKWTKLSLFDIEWFKYCPVCGRSVEEEVRALCAEKGIS